MICLRKHILKIKINDSQRISKYQAETIMCKTWLNSKEFYGLAVQWRHWELSWAGSQLRWPKKRVFGPCKMWYIYNYIFICWALLYVQRNMCIYILNRYIYICVCSLKPSLAIDFYQRWVSNNGSVLLKITKDGGQNDVERF
jgi:hypothetical protein